MKKLVTVLAFSALTSSAFAAHTGTYIGAGLGISRLETSNQNLISEDVTGLSQSHRRGGLGGRIFTGYNVNRYYGVELGLAKYAQSKYTANATDLNVKATNDMTALDLVGKAYLPIEESGFNLYALAGAALVYSKDRDYAQSGADAQSSSVTTRKVRPIVGLGTSYDINSNVSTGVEFTRIVGKGNVKTSNKAIPNADMLSFNVSYSFE